MRYVTVWWSFCISMSTRPMTASATRSWTPSNVFNRARILLLENTRFYPQEKNNDPDFARQLTRCGDLFVNDAFATAHRAHASTEGVARLLPSYAGLLMQRELRSLSPLLDNPDHPYVALIGGAKTADKLHALEHLLPSVDRVLVGGMPASTLLKAKGVNVETSATDEDTADAMIKAVLGRVASRMDEEHARLFAQDLPEPLSLETLHGHQEVTPGFSLDQFVADIQNQFHLEHAHARKLIARILHVVRNNVPTDHKSEWENGLPAEWVRVIEYA